MYFFRDAIETVSEDNLPELIPIERVFVLSSSRNDLYFVCTMSGKTPVTLTTAASAGEVFEFMRWLADEITYALTHCRVIIHESAWRLRLNELEKEGD